MRTPFLAAMALLGLATLAPTVQATMWSMDRLGDPGLGEYTYLGGGPTAWAPGANSAYFHGFIAPAGPMAPGAASWSVMPAGTLSDGFDPHGGSSTTGAGAGALIAGAGAGSELGVYGGALGVWAGVSGFTDLGMVADGGAAFNTPEPGPGNTLFGDMRIGAISGDGPLGVLAHAYQPGTGVTFPGTPTIGGDMHIDDAETWIDVIAGGSGGFDLYSVVLHEFGHSLGLGHSADPSAVMYPFISSDTAKRTLAADDIAGITALYGARTPIPEPSTFMLLGAGLIGLALRRRRRQ